MKQLNSEIKILIVDDEPDILEFVGYNLKKEGYKVFRAPTSEHALKLVANETFDLIILDIMMPLVDGIELCRQIRQLENQKDVLIAFLTARNEDYSQIAGFDAGADDYIAKPIKPRVLISRIKALLRRQHTIHVSEHTVEVGGIRVDAERYVVVKKGQDINLPKKEFELVSLLSSRPGRVFSRDEILSKVWGEDVVVGDRTIDVHINKVREKLGAEYIRTIKGVGYKFDF